MLTVTLRGMLAHLRTPVRVLTAAAIMLGVSFLSGTLVLTRHDRQHPVRLVRPARPAAPTSPCVRTQVIGRQRASAYADPCRDPGTDLARRPRCRRGSPRTC